jgi:serine/threonine-protein kinase
MADFGDLIGEGYRIRGLLGEGGTSRVYLAEHIKNGKLHAIKEIPAEKAERAGMLAEIKLKEKLYHPALPHVWEAFEEKGFIYIVMDYVEGMDLGTFLRKNGAVVQEQAVEWMKQLCKALTYLHGFQPPVIYRDMKPSNIVLQRDGRIKLIDFGAICQKERRGEKVLALGTPGYAAPEQYGKHPRSDVRTDVYGLGMTFYFMLTGQDPSKPSHQIRKIREWNPSLSPVLERIVCKCTRKQPWRRFQTCADLLKALEDYTNA